MKGCLKITCYGTILWKNEEGKFHRDGDLPAGIYADGTQKWFKDGKLHRDGDLPAVIFANETQKWFKDGVPYLLKEFEGYQ